MKYIVDSADLTSVANAIRTKGGTSASLAFPADFVQAIADIPTGGGNETALITGSYNGEIIENDCTTLGRVFSNTTGAFSVRMPELLIMGISQYQVENSSITSFFAPKCRINSRYAFHNCASLSVVVFDYTTSFQSFSNCAALESVDMLSNAAVGKIDNMFSNGNGCPSLTTLILRSGSQVPLTNISAFNKTPFASGGAGGTIYIPKALYDHLGDGTALDYKAATNWSTVNGYGTITWAQIEGSQYENYYADGTPIV